MKQSDTKINNLSRRNFLKVAGGAAAVAGLAGGGVILPTRQAGASGDQLPEKWDETYDVILSAVVLPASPPPLKQKNRAHPSWF
jgi:hypothetical protein